MRKGLTFLVVLLTVGAIAATHAPVAGAGIFKSPLGSAALGALRRSGP